LIANVNMFVLSFIQPKKSDAEEKPKAPAKAPPTTKNKLSKKKYAGDAQNSDEELLESLKEPNRVYTAEELEELRKRADLQKEELKLTMVSDFVSAPGERNSLDNINLVKKEEFLDYSFRLYNRLELLSKSEFYPEFLDNLLTGLTKTMTFEQVKRLSSTLNNISIEKQNEKKKIGKKQVKPQLKADRRNDYDSFTGGDIMTGQDDHEYDEDNDFM